MLGFLQGSGEKGIVDTGFHFILLQPSNVGMRNVLVRKWKHSDLFKSKALVLAATHYTALLCLTKVVENKSKVSLLTLQICRYKEQVFEFFSWILMVAYPFSLHILPILMMNYSFSLLFY